MSISLLFVLIEIRQFFKIVSKLRKKGEKLNVLENLTKTFKRAVGVAQCRPPPFYSARKLQEVRFGHAPVWSRDYAPIPYLNSEAQETDCSRAVTAEGSSGGSGEKGNNRCM